MSDVIKPCPFCKSDSDTMDSPFTRVYCTNRTCLLVGPVRNTEADAIRAWNQMALAFEIARAAVLQEAAESAAWDDENTTQAQHDKCLMVEQDAKNSLPALLEQWRLTDG